MLRASTCEHRRPGEALICVFAQRDHLGTSVQSLAVVIRQIVFVHLASFHPLRRFLQRPSISKLEMEDRRLDVLFDE